MIQAKAVRDQWGERLWVIYNDFDRPLAMVSDYEMRKLLNQIEEQAEATGGRFPDSPANAGGK